jgi:hypothetical protein
MLPPEVHHRASVVSQWLEKHGWRIVEREQPFEDEWWACEIWLIESAWSPQGARAYLTFFVLDLGDDSHYLMASRDRPKARGGEGEPQMSLNRGWQNELPTFIAGLAQFRSEGCRG